MILYDRRIRGIKYKIGDRVMLHLGEKKKQKSNKLIERWRGPYTIIGIRESSDDFNNKTSTYILKPDNNGKNKEAHFNNLKLTSAPITTTLYDNIDDTINNGNTDIVVPQRRRRARLNNDQDNFQADNNDNENVLFQNLFNLLILNTSKIHF